MSARQHRRGAGLAMGLVALLLSAEVGGVRAGGIDAAAIARQGNGRGGPPCMACHGVDGGGNAVADFPRLAGLPAAYLARQLDAFADGTRQNGSMQIAASTLSADERAAMAAYYASLPAPAASFATVAPAAAASAVASGPLPLGERLAIRGRWERGLPACAQCHGPDGVGVGDRFPPLVGQPAGYLAAQLRAWRLGTRRGDPLGLMQAVAGKLDAADIAAVAGWYAAQPRPSNLAAGR